MDECFSRLEIKLKSFKSRFITYIKRLLFPIYLFPIKLITYSAFYAVKFAFKLIYSLILIIIELIVYPFRGLKNFLKSLFILALILYVLASLVVIADYLNENYGYYKKFLCLPSVTIRDNRTKVVRVVGGLGEGSGFFIEPNKVITNFHVIEGENSPKIITPDGNLITPVKMTGDRGMDIADYVNSVGNLTLLHKNDNSDLGNANMDDKVQRVYSVSKLTFNKLLTDKKDSFNNDPHAAISERAVELAGSALVIWKIPAKYR